MRGVRIHDHGSPSQLRVEDINKPSPNADEVLVNVHAVGINPVDTYFREGSYSPAGLPFTPGVDVAGTVLEKGSLIEDVAVGDVVIGTGIGNSAYQGSYAELTCVPQDRVISVPSTIDIEQAGAAGVIGVTAWQALIEYGELSLGETCLVHGAAGGVGHVATQLAAQSGARVIGTARPAYHDRLTNEFGVDVAIDYATADLAGAISSAAPEGVDVILDHRIDESLDLDAAVGGSGARVIAIGEARDETQPSFADTQIARSKDITYRFMSMFNTPDLRHPLRQISSLLASESIAIEIAERYSLAEADVAHQRLEHESFLGKLVMVPQANED